MGPPFWRQRGDLGLDVSGDLYLATRGQHGRGRLRWRLLGPIVSEPDVPARLLFDRDELLELWRHPVDVVGDWAATYERNLGLTRSA